VTTTVLAVAVYEWVGSISAAGVINVESGLDRCLIGRRAWLLNRLIKSLPATVPSIRAIDVVGS